MNDERVNPSEEPTLPGNLNPGGGAMPSDDPTVAGDLNQGVGGNPSDGPTIQAPPSSDTGFTRPTTGMGGGRPSADDRLAPGTQLDDFVVEELIGEGGMGAVYRGRQVSLDRAVAIKVLPQRLATNEQFAVRFLREAKAVAQINSPHVIAVYGAGAAAGVNYFAMEFVEGSDLSHRLKVGKTPSVEQAVDFVAQAAKGLVAANEFGIIHRDIKPANMMVDAKDNLKVMDFGLAKLVDEENALTMTGMVMGTVSYFSPEQGRGEHCDHRTDIYALGVVLFELITGRLPFVAKDASSLIYQHVHTPPPDPVSLVPGLPNGIREIILTCLAKKADDRYQTTQQLVDDLTEVFHGREPVTAVTLLGKFDKTIALDGSGDSVYAGEKSGGSKMPMILGGLAAAAVAGGAGWYFLAGPGASSSTTGSEDKQPTTTFVPETSGQNTTTQSGGSSVSTGPATVIKKPDPVVVDDTPAKPELTKAPASVNLRAAETARSNEDFVFLSEILREAYGTDAWEKDVRAWEALARTPRATDFHNWLQSQVMDNLEAGKVDRAEGYYTDLRKYDRVRNNAGALDDLGQGIRDTREFQMIWQQEMAPALEDERVLTFAEFEPRVADLAFTDRDLTRLSEAFTQAEVISSGVSRGMAALEVGDVTVASSAFSEASDAGSNSLALAGQKAVVASRAFERAVVEKDFETARGALEQMKEYGIPQKVLDTLTLRMESGQNVSEQVNAAWDLVLGSEPARGRDQLQVLVTKKGLPDWLMQEILEKEKKATRLVILLEETEKSMLAGDIDAAAVTVSTAVRDGVDSARLKQVQSQVTSLQGLQPLIVAGRNAQVRLELDALRRDGVPEPVIANVEKQLVLQDRLAELDALIEQNQLDEAVAMLRALSRENPGKVDTVSYDQLIKEKRIMLAFNLALAERNLEQSESALQQIRNVFGAGLEYEDAKTRLEESKLKQEAFENAVLAQANDIRALLQVDEPDFALAQERLRGLTAQAGAEHRQVLAVQQDVRERQQQVAAVVTLRDIEAHVAAGDVGGLSALVEDGAHLSGLQQVAGAAGSSVAYTIQEAGNDSAQVVLAVEAAIVMTGFPLTKRYRYHLREADGRYIVSRVEDLTDQ